MFNGTPNLNPLPYVNIAIQAQARKRAKDEAVNQYYHKLGDSINTAGVRKQDLGDEKQGIIKDINDWKTDLIKNKELYKNNPYAQQDSMGRYQKILNNVEKSKNRGKLELEMGKAKFEGTYDPDDDDLHVIDKISKSIYDPASYKEDGVSEYGWADTNKAIGPFDPNKQNAFFKSAIGVNKPLYDESKARIDNVTGDIFIPQKYTPQQIKSIADNTGNIFEGSREAKKHYNKLLYDPSFINDANDAYQSVYGKDKMINSAKDLAKADAIMRLNDQESEVKVTDPNYRQKLQMDLIARRGEETRRNQRANDKLIRGRAKDGTTYQIDNVPLKLRNSATVIPTLLGDKNEQGVDVTNWSDAELDDVLGKDKNKYGIRDNKPFEYEGKKYIKVTPDGFQFQNLKGEPVTVNDKEVIVNTDKRTRGLEKPVGTGKAVIRSGNTPAPAGFSLNATDRKKKN
jgi:hypothetical protein